MSHSHRSLCDLYFLLSEDERVHSQFHDRLTQTGYIWRYLDAAESMLELLYLRKDGRCGYLMADVESLVSSAILPAKDGQLSIEVAWKMIDEMPPEDSSVKIMKAVATASRVTMAGQKTVVNSLIERALSFTYGKKEPAADVAAGPINPYPAGQEAKETPHGVG